MESIKDEDETGNNIMQDTAMNPANDFKSSKRELNEKRVEFSIGTPKKSKINKSRPKSVLKRFNIDTHR